MAFGTSRSVRFQDKLKYKIDGRPCRSFKAKVLSRVFSEDYERVKKRILDPRGPTIRKWNKIFLAACLVSLFVDPLFFYLPTMVKRDVCIEIELTLEVVLTTVRSLADIFYAVQIYMRFRTAYVAPSSRVFGRGELVIDSSKIASRYLRNYFWVDSLAALPLPQILIWGVIPNLKGSMMMNTKNVLRFIIIFQYIPRLFLIFPLSSQIVKATGVVTETAWAGAAYNLILYMLASHFLGASWYLLSIERQEACWRHACDLERSSCLYKYFDSHMVSDGRRNAWFLSSNVTNLCNPENALYPFALPFGIYGDAVTTEITSDNFLNKYFYCLWWGLKNLSSLGQNLDTSTFIGEISFAILIATLGLVLFALLIGNMQTYLQSTTVRLEEWRIRRTDTEQWMHHRQLPPDLRQAVRKYDQYKWLATRGVDEELLLEGLPLDLRRDIKRHLCYDLVRRVPLFDRMDPRTLDAVCERLKPALCTQGTCLVREGDPVTEMLFVVRGGLDSSTTDGGRAGFFDSCRIGPGEFCGEELLTWALGDDPSAAATTLPSSTRTVRAVSEVEAFALRAEDLRFVAGRFRRLHSKQVRHRFRFYSQQWRSWAACFIQSAWRRHRRRRGEAELRELERLAAGPGRVGSDSSKMKKSLSKPSEPDFSSAEEE